MKNVKALIFIKGSIKTVFKNTRYILFATLLALTIFSSFIFLNNIPSFYTSLVVNKSLTLTLKVFLIAIERMIAVAGIGYFSGIIIVVILAGINLAMFIYKVNSTRMAGTKEGLTSFGGVLGGALSAACPACSTALISLLGVSGGLSILPLKGIEFISLALVLLFISLYLISKSMVECGLCKECRVGRK